MVASAFETLVESVVILILVVTIESAVVVSALTLVIALVVVITTKSTVVVAALILLMTPVLVLTLELSADESVSVVMVDDDVVV